MAGAGLPAQRRCRSRPIGRGMGFNVLSQGQTEDFVYVDGKTYRVQVTRLKQVVTSKPPS